MFLNSAAHWLLDNWELSAAPTAGMNVRERQGVVEWEAVRLNHEESCEIGWDDRYDKMGASVLCESTLRVAFPTQDVSKRSSKFAAASLSVRYVGTVGAAHKGQR